MMWWPSAFLLVLCVAAVSGSVKAESTVQRFVCVFDRHVSPETNGVSSDSTLRTEFVVDGTGHAFAVGRNVYPVRVVVGNQGVTFLEELVTGAVQTTTIHETGSAVHSRHTMFSVAGEIMPSQYYGTCK